MAPPSNKYLPSLMVIIMASSILCSKMEEEAAILKYGVKKALTSSDTEIIRQKKTNSSSIKLTFYREGVPLSVCLLVPPVPERRCRILRGRICRPEFVLKHEVEIVKNCSRQGIRESCQTRRFNQKVKIDTVLCQWNPDCFTANKGVNCFENRVAICQQNVKVMTVTEKRQKCRGSGYRTTKICITKDVGNWTCKEFSSDGCDDRDSLKLVRSEAVLGQFNCSQKSLGNTVCPLKDGCDPLNMVSCVREKIPQQIRLKEEVCQQCSVGSKIVTPRIKRQRVCRDSTTEHVCVDVQDFLKWEKFCLDKKKAGLESEKEDISLKVIQCLRDSKRCTL